MGGPDGGKSRLDETKSNMNLQTVVSLLENHSYIYQDAYIFGSVARGTEDEYSDVDIIMVRNTALPFFDRIREIMNLRRMLGSADLMIYTPDEIVTMLDEPGRYFIKDAIKDGYHVEGKQQRGTQVVSSS